jgi:predicted nucleic acid-binding protein
MILPDVNVLIYAFRRDLPQHAVCRAWLAGVVMSDARFGLSPLVLGAVVRVTTNPRVYRMPSTIEEAFGLCENRKTPLPDRRAGRAALGYLQATLHRDGNARIPCY